MVTVHVTVRVTPHPDQEENLLLPTEAGAVRVTVTPESYVCVKLVVPLAAWFASAGEIVMATPLEGLEELTVSVNVVGEEDAEVPPLLPPQAAMKIQVAHATWHASLKECCQVQWPISVSLRCLKQHGEQVNALILAVSYCLNLCNCTARPGCVARQPCAKNALR